MVFGQVVDVIICHVVIFRNLCREKERERERERERETDTDTDTDTDTHTRCTPCTKQTDRHN